LPVFTPPIFCFADFSGRVSGISFAATTEWKNSEQTPDAYSSFDGIVNIVKSTSSLAPTASEQDAS
jgi:hypothetical protein